MALRCSSAGFWLWVGCLAAGIAWPTFPCVGQEAPGQAREQLVNDFEGVRTSWTVHASDSLQATGAHRRTDQAALLGQRCEFIAAVGRRGGDAIYLSHHVPPSALIDEFAANLWLRGDRSGYQLLVRVRLPRCLDNEGQPLAMLLEGDQYLAAGQWQQLTARDLRPRLAEMTRIWRAQHNRPIDPTEAYVDLVVLNVFGDAGVNRVWIDDLTVEGSIPRQTAVPALMRVQSTASLTTPRVAWKGGIMELNGKPFLPRAVTHRGEALTTLADLGFNTVALESPATEEQNAAAKRLGLWLLSPPPPSAREMAALDRVLGWWIDEDFAGSTQDFQSLRAADVGARPIVALVTAAAPWQEECDVVIAGQPLNGGERAAAQPVRWQLVGRPLGDWSRWLPLRAQLHGALAAGAKGFLLATDRSLEVNTATHPRHLAELFNLELTLGEPWQLSGDTRQTKGASHHVTLFAQDHSTLAIIRREQSGHSPLRQPISISDFSRRDVYVVEPGGLAPARHHHIPGGVRVSLRQQYPLVKLLLTDRAEVVHQLNTHLQSVGERFNELLVLSARHELKDLDRHIQYTTSSALRKAKLRENLYALQNQFQPLLEGTRGNVTVRDLEQMFWQLEELRLELEAAQ